MNKFIMPGVLFFAMASASFIGGYILNPIHPNESEIARVPFEIRQGEGVLDVTTRLLENGIIRSRASFLVYAAFTGAAQNIKPGLYALLPGNIPNVIRTLIQGPQEVVVTLYPGMTISEMDKKLYENGVIRRHELEDLSASRPLEGFLLPDTYYFRQQSDVKTVAQKMRDNFDKKTADLFKGMEPEDISRTMIIASLVEKEVSDSEDRKIVAGIIYKRLQDEYPLQIDASVAYGACGGVYAECKTFTAESFKKDTPYNTYTRAGLPPHPISNPSLNAIEAALRPERTGYYFYLSDRETGKTYFSVTFEEHTAKREKYLK